MSQVTAFITARGGQAPSTALVSHFKQQLAPEHTPLFKQALKQLAVRKTVQGQSVWVLKEGRKEGAGAEEEEEEDMFTAAGRRG